MIELNPVRQRIADLTGRLRCAQGVSLTTTPRSSVWKKSTANSKAPTSGTTPSARRRWAASARSLDKTVNGIRELTEGLVGADELLELAEMEDDEDTAQAVVADVERYRARRRPARVPAHVLRQDGFALGLRRHPGRRRRHRGAGLGRDAAAHVPALGRVARLEDRAARSQRRRSGGHQVAPRSASRAITPTAG